MSTAWRDGRDGRNPKRSGSRPAPRARSRGPAHSRVEYISAHGPNPQYPHYDDASSDSSLERYTTASMRRRSIHIPRGSLPRAPAAPGSPTSEPSLDSSSDSPSSRTSSRFGTLSPGSEINPAIVDDNWHSYTGAYFRGAHAHADQAWGPPPAPATPALAKRRPVVPNPHAHPHPSSPATDISSPGRRGGPKARSYLSADAPREPPEPVVIEVKRAESPPPGPSVIETLPVVPVYPVGVRPMRLHRREAYYSDEEEDDEDEDLHYRRNRRQSRPRYSIRHVEARPRSRSRHRRRPVEEDEKPRHRHRSRSRHHRHHHRSKSRPRPRSPPPEDPGIAAALRAEIDALQAKLSNIMDDPYAKDIIAQEGIKFDVLFKDPEEKAKS